MDELDRAERITEQMVSSRIRHIHHQATKIFDGQSGSEPRYCEECGELIDPARLKIVPGTKYCVKCKAILENHKR